MAENITVRARDLIRRADIFDGEEPAFLEQEFEIPGSGGITFQARQFLDHSFADLKNILGTETFDQIVEEQGYVIPTGPFGKWWGTERLELFYFLHQAPDADFTSVVLIAFGELQPGRYKIHVEGIWDIDGLPPLK